MLFATPRAVLAQVRRHVAPSNCPACLTGAASRRRLLSTLAVLEQRDGKLNHGSLSSVTAAKQLGGSIHGFVAGSNITAVAAEAAKVDGVEKIIAVENAAYDKVSHVPLRSTPDCECGCRD